MTAPPPLSLVAERVTAGYAHTPVLHDLSLAAAPGAVLGLIGPNGAGKTTLLRTLSGVHRPLSGHVRLGEASVPDLPARQRARQIAFVPQGVVIPVPFTVAEIAAMGRLPYVGGWAPLTPNDEQAVANALEQVGLRDKAERSMHTLSAGEQQRALLALALAQQPRVLLLDEPTAHLDLHHAWRLMEMIRELAARERLIVVLSTHDLSLAASCCTQLALLERGRLAACGAHTAVLQADLLSRAYGHPLAVSAVGDRWWVHPV